MRNSAVLDAGCEDRQRGDYTNSEVRSKLTLSATTACEVGTWAGGGTSSARVVVGTFKAGGGARAVVRVVVSGTALSAAWDCVCLLSLESLKFLTSRDCTLCRSPLLLDPIREPAARRRCRLCWAPIVLAEVVEVQVGESVAVFHLIRP